MTSSHCLGITCSLIVRLWGMLWRHIRLVGMMVQQSLPTISRLKSTEPHAARSRLASLNHSECCDVVMSDLVRAHPDLPDLVSRIDIWRWGHAMIRPIPGLIWGGARNEAYQPQGRVHFANIDLSGLALFEEAHAHGIRAADAILNELRTVPTVG